MKHAVLLLLALGPLAARAQTPLSGRVLDRATRQPVPYASVVVPGTALGTTANAEGEFVLRVPQLPAKVLAFSLGYGRDSATVAQPGAALAFSLAPAPIALPAAEPAGYAAELLARAYRELARTHGHHLYGQAFYRQLTRLADEPVEMQEMVWDVKSTNAGLEGMHYVQGRYAQKKALLHFNHFSTYTRALDIFSANADSATTKAIIGPDAAQYYTLRLKGLARSGNQQVAEIAFASKPLPDFPSRQGSVFIDVDTYQVLHFVASVPVHSTSNNPLFGFKNPSLTFEFDLLPHPDGAVPNYIKVTYQSLITRPLKSDLKSETTSFAFFYHNQPAATGLAYDPADTPLDLATIKQRTYDPGFWRDNPVVKRTPQEEEIIKLFEQQRAFGTMLDK